MLNVRTIVNSALFTLCCMPLMGCGQKGPLYLPTEPEAAGRATLPDTLLGPLRPRKPASAVPATTVPEPVNLPKYNSQPPSDDFMTSTPEASSR